MHTHSCIHTFTYTLTHTHSRIHTLTYTLSHTHFHIHTHAYTLSHTHFHTHTHAHPLTHTHARIHTHKRGFLFFLPALCLERIYFATQIRNLPAHVLITIYITNTNVM